MAISQRNFIGILILISILVGIGIGFIGGIWTDRALEDDCREECEFAYHADLEKCKTGTHIPSEKEKCDLFAELMSHKCQAGCRGLF